MKYFVYHCSVSEIDVQNHEVSSVLEAHSEDTKRVPQTKEEALTELRDIIDKHCNQSLRAEIERLNRVVTILDQKLANALTISI